MTPAILFLAGDLKKVELILPPPARPDAGAPEGALPRSTQKALGRLLAACGLSAEFSGGLASILAPASVPRSAVVMFGTQL